MTVTGPLLLFVVLAIVAGAKSEYYGKLIGKLSELHHGVSGEVYAVDGRTLYIKDYTYDGQGPAAYFYASTYKNPDSKGFRLRDENNNGEVIRKYRKEGVTLTLPEGKNLNNIKVFYVYCEEFDVSFGDVKIPRSFDYPRPQKIDALKGVHGIASDNIVVVDAQTLLIPNLHYDGEAPDAKFWVGYGPKPSPQGIRVSDENGKEVPLRKYDGKTVVLTLPGDLTVFDIGHFGIWCEQFTVDFGHIQIPQSLNIPPSLKMLGVSPQRRHQVIPDAYPTNQREVAVRRPQFGGHLEPITTFRPPANYHIQRRYEQNYEPQIRQNLGYQQQYQQPHQFGQQPRQLVPFEQRSPFLQQFVGQYQQVPLGYQPLYPQQQQHRFDLQPNHVQQGYVPFG